MTEFYSQVATAAADLDVLHLVPVVSHRVPVEAAVLVPTAGVGGLARVEKVVAAEMLLALGLPDVCLTELNTSQSSLISPGPPHHTHRV